MEMCGTMLVASVTANCLILLYLLANQGVRLVLRYRVRRSRDLTKGALVKAGQLEEFIRRNRGNLSSIFVDCLATVVLFAGGLYLLTAGNAVSQPFTVHSDPSADFASVLFALAIGRLGFAFVFGIWRMRTVGTATSASVSMMQCIDHIVALVALVLITIHSEDLFTGTTILIMSIDTNLYTCSILLNKLQSDDLSRFRLGLKVSQCFLSIAFRFAVPFVCMVVSLTDHRQELAETKPESLAIFISTAIFYAAYNSWVIFNGVRCVWKACAHTKDSAEKKDATYFVKNNSSVSTTNKVSLAFNITKDNNKKVLDSRTLISPFVDLETYPNDNIPPPYENYRRLPMISGFSRQALQVPSNNGNCVGMEHRLPSCARGVPQCCVVSARTANQQAGISGQSARRKQTRGKGPLVVPSELNVIPEDRESVSSDNV